jgi:hypothetical protein
MRLAGYSGTPLAKKLGLKSGLVAHLRNVPEELRSVFVELDSRARLAGQLDYIHVFETDASALAELMPRLAAAMTDQGMIWVSWPKKASKQPTTLDEQVVRTLALGAGLVDVKVCAVDDVWSGLKLVRRLADRKGKKS